MIAIVDGTGGGGVLIAIVDGGGADRDCWRGGGGGVGHPWEYATGGCAIVTNDGGAGCGGGEKKVPDPTSEACYFLWKKIKIFTRGGGSAKISPGTQGGSKWRGRGSCSGVFRLKLSPDVGAEAQASRQPCAGRGFCLRHHNFLFRPCCFGDKSVSAESRKCAFGPFSAEDFRWPKFRCIPRKYLNLASLVCVRVCCQAHGHSSPWGWQLSPYLCPCHCPLFRFLFFLLSLIGSGSLNATHFKS